MGILEDVDVLVGGDLGTIVSHIAGIANDK
jgi:hypothetical protein